MKSNIDSSFRLSNMDRIYQGDILKDLTILDYDYGSNGWNIGNLSFPFIVVLSQDCDLEGDFVKRELFESNNIDGLSEERIRTYYNKFLKSIIFSPVFYADALREGSHIESEFNHKFNSKDWKKLKQNTNHRYHFIEGTQFNDLTIPDLVIDFKYCFSVPRDYLYSQLNDHYFVSLNELFRENLSMRFYTFQYRIGLPVF